MSSQSEVVAAASVAIAEKATKDLKNPTWNVPNEIRLVPGTELVVGRCPGKNKAGSKSLILHSPKLPSMLSRKHALIKYDTKVKQWTITDLKVFYHCNLKQYRFENCVWTLII